MLLFGILFILERSIPALLAATAVLIFLFFSYPKEYKNKIGFKIRIILLVLVFFAGAGRALGYETAKNLRRNFLIDNEEALLRGRVLRIGEKNERLIYTLSPTRLFMNQREQTFPRVLLYLPKEEAVRAGTGQSLTVHGRVRLPAEAENFGNFDQKAYYDGLDTDFLFFGDRVEGVYGSEAPLRSALNRFSDALSGVYRALMKEKEAALLSTMILGDKSGLDPGIKELYRSSGISHILAISGLHISVIGILLYRILRKLRTPFLPSAVAGGTLILMYAELTGRSPSAFRAAFMFTLSVFAPVMKRSYDLLTGLSLSALVLLLENPAVYRNTGFVFSYLAVLGVTVMGKELKTSRIRGPEEKKGLRKFVSARLRSFSDTLAAAFGVQLTTVPLVMATSFSVPLYALPLNLLVLPLTGILMLSGLTGGILGMCALYGGVFDVQVAKIVLFIPELIFGLYERLCLWFEKLPYADLVTGKPEGWKVALYFCFLLAALYLLRGKRKKLMVMLVTAALVGLGLSSKHRGFELSLLSVGQGDAIFLQAENGDVCMVDGGSTDVEEVGKYRIFPFLRAMGTDHVDWWLVSHADQDHISALKEALSGGFPIKHLLFSRYIVRDEAFFELKTLAEEKGIPVLYLSPGEALRMGESSLTCLFPGKGEGEEERNARSLVLRLEQRNFSALLTGDISSEEEALLLKHGVQEADFYKAAHHGSAYSNSEDFLKAVSPKVCGISCALKNRYHHPGEEALSHMKKTGAEIFETRFQGQIRLRLNGDEMEVRTMKEAQPPAQ